MSVLFILRRNMTNTYEFFRSKAVTCRSELCCGCYRNRNKNKTKEKCRNVEGRKAFQVKLEKKLRGSENILN